MSQTILQVDAFTDRPFSGNPAAICVLPGPADDAWMQSVALEMNLSETAFLYPESAEVYRLRWFTPTVEVDLCGHATLATAHALWSEGHLAADKPARFQTRSGELTAVRNGDWIELDFPAIPLDPSRSADLEAVSQALNAKVVYAARNLFDLLAEVDTEEALRSLVPDMGKIAAFPVRGVIATARATTPGFDFVSRFFAPNLGVPEDPVCGSAHCCLGPYWAAKLSKTELIAYQASPRGGVLKLGVRGGRIKLAGQAVTVMRGELLGSARTSRLG